VLIDIHVHCAFPRHPKLCRSNGSRYPTPDELLRMMDGARIDKAVVLCGVSPEVRSTVVPPEEVIEICKTRPDRLIPFFNADPRFLTNDTNADFTNLIEAYVEMGCKGIGEFMPNLPFDDPLCMNFFHYVEKAGLPLTFHLAPRQGSFYGLVDEVGLPRLERALIAFPKLVFLGHSQPFWAEVGRNLIEKGQRIPYPKGPVEPGRLVELMRLYPNLMGDLSAGSGFGAVSRDLEFGCAFMEEFQDRLLWGTDIANVPQELPIVDFFRKIEEEKLISEAAYEKITWRNANRLLGLGLQE